MPNVATDVLARIDALDREISALRALRVQLLRAPLTNLERTFA